MDRSTSGDEMDADYEQSHGLSRLGAFLGGALLGFALCAAAAVAISLTGPLPGDPPPPARVEISGAAPIATEAQLAEGEPFSAGADLPTAEETAAEGESFSAGDDMSADEGSAQIAEGEPFSIGADAPEIGETSAEPPAATADATPLAEEPVANTAPQELAAASAGEPVSAAGDPPASLTLPQDEPGPAIAPAAAPEVTFAVPEAGEAASATAAPTSDPTADDEAVASGPGQAGPTDATATEPLEQVIGDDTIASAPAAGPETAPAPSVGALAENASAFDAPRQTPLMAVVLVGEDVGALTGERLSLLTMPLTVAIPPADPRAAELGEAARAAGHEVLADLPLAGASGAAAAERVAALDMAVGATASDGTAQADVLEPVLAELGRQGLAWVDTGAGIGTPAERIAREIGMAYTQGDRTVGGTGSPEQIYRAIDSAAHQARQWGTSVLFIDAGEPALQALVRWGLEQSGENPVWFAPISAVIERRARM